jgi:hypothetical protein
LIFPVQRHLHHNHAGQSNTPVLLSNDALLSNPNTKYEEKRKVSNVIFVLLDFNVDFVVDIKAMSMNLLNILPKNIEWM